jgi:HD superfamily phosphohydrolase YqeK
MELPAWAQVGDKRRAHIERVTALLDRWATEMSLDAAEAQEWHDAGCMHDALRDAPENTLRSLAGEMPGFSVDMLHGPAAAAYLEQHGEEREGLISAVRYHTVGSNQWTRTGKALYMADYLEPGRKFARADRTYLAARVPDDFEATFRQVIRARLEWSLREGMQLYPETVALWNSVR